MLLCIKDLILTERTISGDDSCINPSIKILNRHEVLGDTLTEIAVQELQPNQGGLGERIVEELRAIADCFGEHLNVLRPLWLKAAVGSRDSMLYGVCIFNFLSLDVLSTRTHVDIFLKDCSHANYLRY